MSEIETVMVIGGPRCGKSKLSKALRELHGFSTFCGDPRDKVKEPEPRVTYLAEGLGMGSESTRYIVDHWLPMPGRKVLEGHNMARVLRKWIEDTHGSDGAFTGDFLSGYPCDRIVVFDEQHPEAKLKPGQSAMHKGVMKVWREIGDYFEGMTTTVSWSDPRFADLSPGELARLILGR